jgi:hypothetical protein
LDGAAAAGDLLSTKPRPASRLGPDSIESHVSLAMSPPLPASVVAAGAVGAGSGDFLASVDDGRAGFTRSEADKLVATSLAILVDLTEQAHVFCQKLLVARTKESVDAKVSSVAFVGYFNEALVFIQATEALTSRPCAQFRGALLTQVLREVDRFFFVLLLLLLLLLNQFVFLSFFKARHHIERFHEQQKEKLTHLLANETWQQVEAPTEFQRILDRMATGDFTAENGHESNGGALDHVRLGDQSYFTVTAVLL